MATVSCEPASLTEAAKCIDQQIPDGMKPAVIVYLLAKIAGVSVATSSDIKTLLDNSKCLSCIPEGQQADVTNYLLCQIAND